MIFFRYKRNGVNMSFFVTAGPDHFRQKYSTTVYVAMLSDQPAAADDF